MKKITIIGSTGIVGESLISLIKKSQTSKILGLEALYKNQLEIKYCASDDYLDFYKDNKIKKFSCEELKNSDIAIFNSSNLVSELYVMEALQHVKLVIDASSVYRLKSQIPMVQFSINGDRLTGKESLVTTPNCLVASIVDPLYLLHKKFSIKNLTITSLQSVSGAGSAPLKKLCADTLKITEKLKQYWHNKQAGLIENYALESKNQLIETNPTTYAYNVLPSIGKLQDDQYASSEEEKKIKEELFYLLQDNFEFNITAMRVPSILGHIASCKIDLGKSFKTLNEVKEVLNSAYTKTYNNDEAPANYELFYQDSISHITRLRYQGKNSISCIIMANNLIQGTAINVLRVLNHFIKTQ